MGYNKKVLRAIDRELKDRYRSKRYSKSLSATNSLFAPNYLFSKPSKRRIYNPNAKYFKHGGSHEGDPPIKSIFDPRYKKYFKIANDNYKIRQLLKEYDKNWNDSIIDVDNKIVKPDSILFKKDHRSVVDDLKSLTGKDLRTEPRPYKIKDSGETFTKNFDSSIFSFLFLGNFSILIILFGIILVGKCLINLFFKLSTLNLPSINVTNFSLLLTV